jgi:hypothetical protein
LLWHSPNKGLPSAGIGNAEPDDQSAAASQASFVRRHILQRD